MAQAPFMRPINEIEQKIMRLTLEQAMKIKARLDRKPSLGEFLLRRLLQRIVIAGRFFRGAALLGYRFSHFARKCGFRFLDLCRMGFLFRLEGGKVGPAFLEGAGGFCHLAPEYPLFGIEFTSAAHAPNLPAAALGIRI